MESYLNENTFSLPEGLALIGVYPKFRRANEHALVILSMRLPYWMLEHEGQYHLCVETQHLTAAQIQIAKHDEENRFWPPKPLTTPASQNPTSAWGLLGYVLVLMSVFTAQQHSQITEWGRLDAEAIFNHQAWWRVLTPLFLHADITHLAANLLSGLCFGALAGRIFGARWSWPLILLSGILGNTLTAWLYFPEPHFSIGASTAIFGALGLIVGHEWITLWRHSAGWLNWFQRGLPLFAGLTLLALLGTSGERTDVVAHVSGFLCGLGLGILKNALTPASKQVPN